MPEGSPVDRFYIPQRPASGRAQLPDWVLDKAKSFLPGLPPPVGSDGFNVDLTQRDLEELAASYVVGATVELAVRRIGLPLSECASAGLFTPEGKFTPGPAPNPGDHSLKPFFKLWGGFVTPLGNDLHEPSPSPSVSFYDPWAELGGPAFPLETLPPFLKAFAQAASASAGMDASAYAIAGLSALAASIPATVRVHLGGEHYVRPNAWVALVGDPSCGKSPVIETCVKPLRKLDDDEARQHTVALGNWESAKKLRLLKGYQRRLSHVSLSRM